MNASASCGARRDAAERRQQLALVLALREAGAAGARDRPARVEHVARAVEQPDDAHAAALRRTAIASTSARPTRPKPSSTTSVCGASGGAAAADLVELERGVDPPRGLRRLRPRATTNEMLRSDEPCAIAITLSPLRASAVNTRAAMPGVPAMPSPTTAITATPGRAATPSMRPRASSSRNARPQRRHRAVGLRSRTA